MSMQTRTEVEITPPQDTARIHVARAGRYSLVFMRDTYSSQLTLLFPDFESLARVIDKLYDDVTNLRKSREKRIRPRQCPVRVPCNTHTIVCVLREGHSGRHQDAEGGIWSRRGQSCLVGHRPRRGGQGGTFEIWSEGYAATGERAGAMYHGTADGDSFLEACERYALMNTGFGRYFDREELTYWGCRLFSNEAAARKSFG